MQTLSIKAKLTLITLVFLIGTSGINAYAGLLDSLFSGKLNNPASTNTTVAGVRLQTISSTYTLPDATTKRLSILIWYPVTSQGSLDLQGAPYPLIVFSHGGITGAADHCASITENLAKQGYIVAATTHEDSIYYQGKKSASPLAAGFWDRPLDVKGIITILLGLNNDRGSTFYGAIDEEAIGVFGHSLGGWTGEILCGAVPPGREDYTDERVKAGMFLAPGNMLFNKNNIANVRVPSITIFGGKDTIVRTGSNKFVYDQAAVPKYFGVITNFSHLDFANYGKSKPETKVLVQYTLAFFDRYLKDDYSAEETLKTSSPIFSAYEYELERQGESDNPPQGATVPIVMRAEEDSDEDAQTEDATTSDATTTAADPLGSLFGGGTGGIGSLLGGGLTGSGNSGMPAWVGWNGRTFGVHLGQRPATGTGSQSSLSSGLTGGTGGLGNLLGGLTGGTGSTGNLLSGLTGGSGTGGLGGLLGGLTGGTGTGGIGNLLGGLGGLTNNSGTTSTGSAATSSQTQATGNTTSASSGAGGISSLFGGLLGGGSPDSALSGITPGNGGLTDVIGGVLIDPPDVSDQPQSSSSEKADQMALMEASTIRLPLGRVTGGSPQTYGGVTAGTPEIFDGIISNKGTSSWGNALSFGFGPFDQYELYGKNYIGEDQGGTPLTLNDLAVWQFFGIKDAGFQDILLEQTSNDRGLTHAQWSEQYRIYAQYVITYMPDHAGVNYSDGVIACTGKNLITYMYFHPQSTLLVEICVWNNCPFDLTPGGSTGNSGTSSITGLLGGLTGGSGTSGAGGTGGMGNLLGGLLGGSGGTGGLGSLTGSAGGLGTSSATDRTSSNSGAVSSSDWQEIPAYGTELETVEAWQETTSTDNTTDNNGDESSNNISTTEDTEQTTTIDPTTLRLPLVEVNGSSPNMYGGLTEGTPHLFDGLLEAIQNNNGNADFGDLAAGVNLNEIAARQFLGINDPHFTDTGDYTGFIPNGKGHIQVDEQNGLTAIYYIQPKLPSANKSLMAVSPGGSLSRVGSGLVYVYYDPKTELYIHIDLYTGIMGSTGKLLGGLLGGGR